MRRPSMSPSKYAIQIPSMDAEYAPATLSMYMDQASCDDSLSQVVERLDDSPIELTSDSVLLASWSGKCAIQQEIVHIMIPAESSAA